MNTVTNKVILVGRLGNNPEVKHLEGGRSVARLSLATNESYKDKDGDRITQTHWHNLVAWGKLADMAEKALTKGCEISIEGKLANRSYTDKAGNKKYITEIVVHELNLLSEKQNAESAV